MSEPAAKGKRVMSWIFWILYGIDMVIAVIIVGYFVIGLGDGSVRAFNSGVWAITLLCLAAIMIGSLLLRSFLEGVLSILLLLVLAVPALLYGLFLLVVLSSPGSSH